MSIAALALGLALSIPALPQGTGQPQQEAAQHLRRGIELLDADQPQAALTELFQAVALRPSNPAGRYHLGRALHAAGRYRDAVEQLSIGLPSAADPSAFELLMGQALIELGRLTEARAALDAAAASRPGYPPIYNQLARICYRAGNIEAALEKYAQTAEMAPRWIVPRLQAASIAAEAGDTSTAATLFRAALDIEPARPLIWIRLGDALAAELDYEGAVEAYRAAIEAGPELLSTRLALAYLYFNRQQFDEAAEALTEVLQRWPDNPQGLLPQAEIEMIDGRYEEALGRLDVALREIDRAAVASLPPGATPDNLPPSVLRFRAQELRAKTLLNLNRLAEAAAAARDLLAADPSNLDGLFVLGTALVRDRNPEGRTYLTDFQRLSDAREHRELALEYFRRGSDPVRAESEYRKALTIDPDDPRALLGLGTAQLAQGAAQEAVETLQRARQSGADGPDWYREWALALHRVGRTDEANSAWREAQQRRFILGARVWAALGEHGGAC